jgi:LuxR family maltose regulon positive regulatory protein
MENGMRTEAARYYEQAGDYRGVFNAAYSFPGLMPANTAAFFMELIDRLPAGEGKGGEDYPALLRYTVRPKLLFELGRFNEASDEWQRIIRQFESLPLTPQNSKILAMNYICLGGLALFSCRSTKNYHFLPLFEKALYYYEKQPFRVEDVLTKCGLPSYVCQVAYPAEKGLFELFIRALAAVEPCAGRIFRGFLSGTSSLAWSEFYYFKGDIDTAEKYARQSLFQARKNRQHETESRGLFFLLRIGIHTGDQEEIENLLRQLKNQLDRTDFFNRFVLYDLVSGWFYAQTGSTGRIAPWLKSNFEKNESNPFRPFETLVKTKYAYAEKRYDVVLQILENQTDPGGIGSFYLGKLEAALLKSAARYHLGDTHAALADLEEAYKISFSQSFNMPFIELGEDIDPLADMVFCGEKTSIPSEWLDKIRNRASAYGKKLGILAESLRQPDRSRASGRDLPEDPPAPVLRRLEAMVLVALSRGLTREEIARNEQISLNAVKENIKNLYDKLGALNRADAIRIANSMGLLRKFEKFSH